MLEAQATGVSAFLMRAVRGNALFPRNAGMTGDKQGGWLRDHLQGRARVDPKVTVAATLA
ncbi:hypothetical protein VMCG_06312 [Cytospora schulzeri]|uniref:Uncharacterized protein n=1 Tax=Cytospora schulzeri TaxID=448051 RepID=A0A423W819_9PEZI|nr:hypothetical protein VMCG_06312 [Valsa malicola]